MKKLVFMFVAVAAAQQAPVDTDSIAEVSDSMVNDSLSNDSIVEVADSAANAE